ncbi:MAG: FtsW/RodA/SpoVE family cell cycle protein [Acidimicrobiales bacterium]
MNRPFPNHQSGLLTFVRTLDPVLIGVILALTSLGLAAIASTTNAAAGETGFLVRQLMFLVIGFGLFSFAARIDYRTIRPLVPIGFVLTLIVLVAVLGPFGTTVNGTRGWIRVGGLSVQPAEFAKLAVIASLALALSRPQGRRYDRMPDPATDPRRMMSALAMLGVVMMLVLAEGETGSVLVYCMVAVAIFFIAGSPPRLLGLLVVSGVLAFVLAFSSGLLGDHVADRFTSFLDAGADPRGAGYNQIQSVTAVGSGGLIGQGIFNGPQTQFGFLPEKQTDFIFAAVGEEAGFVGVLVLLGLYGLLLRRIFRTAKEASDRFGQLLAIGVFAMVLFQVVQNVGMTIGVLPITGIPLPLVSYGGSSLLTTLLGLGIVQSVARHRSPSLDPPEQPQVILDHGTNTGASIITGEQTSPVPLGADA